MAVESPFFSIASEDKSIEYLNNIFGPMNGVLGPSGAQTITLFGTMFNTFNSIVLVVGAFIVVYVTVVGVMMTAQEGEFMGKKWNNIWIPIRTVMGIAALVPTGSGYSGLQIIMMWIIVQGIGAADTMWNTVLNYVSTYGSPYAQVEVIQTASTKASYAIKDIFKSVMCTKTAAINQKSGGVEELQGYTFYYCADNNNKNGDFCSKNQGNNFKLDRNAQTNTYDFGPGGACGQLTYCNEKQECENQNSVQCSVCQAQKNAIETIMSTFEKLAEKYNEIDKNYIFFYGGTADKDITNSAITQFFGNPQRTLWTAPSWVSEYCSSKNITACFRKTVTILLSPPFTSTTVNGELSDFNPYQDEGAGKGIGSTPLNVISKMYWPYAFKQTALADDTHFMQTMVDYYSSAITAPVSLDQMNRLADEKRSVDPTFEKTKKWGWLTAGMFYYDVSRGVKVTMDVATPEIEMKLSNASPDNTGSLVGYRNNYRAAETIAALSLGKPITEDGALNVPMSDMIDGISAAFLKNVNQTGLVDPLISIVTAGYAMLVSVQIAFTAFMILAVIAAATSSINLIVLGTGMTESPFKNAFLVLMNFLMPLFFITCGAMVTYGGMLAYYVPLIPYVIFLMGTLGWFLSTIEAMVAGPLVALGILSPSGHHEIMGKAEPAIMLLFNIFLRPTLMIFGLIAAMFMAAVGVSIVNFGFETTVISVGKYATDAKTIGWGGPLGLVFVLGIYVMLVITVLNKAFAAIHIIPEKVMRWIGGQGEQYSEGEAVSGMKEATSGAASGAKGYGSQAQSGAQKSVKAGAEKVNAAKKEEKQAKLAATAAGEKKREESGKEGPLGRGGEFNSED